MHLSEQELGELETEVRHQIAELEELFRHELERYKNESTSKNTYSKILTHLEDLRVLGKLLAHEKLMCYAEIFYDVVNILLHNKGPQFALITDWNHVLSLQLYDLKEQLERDTLIQDLDFGISEKPDLHYPELGGIEKLKSLKILFVEDEEEPRRTAVAYLKRRVGELYEAANGQEGLELYKRHKPDIIITDLNMPVMGGISMLKKIREVNPFVPVIITTAYGDKPYYMEANRLIIHTYLVKPFSLQDLEKELLKLTGLL